MSDRSGKSAAKVAILLVAALIAFAGLVEGVASWVRAVSAPEVEGSNAVNTDPLMSWENMPKVTEAKAQIAIKEVRQREGWFGKVTHSERGELGWEVTVGQEPDVPHDYRVIEVDTDTGKVGDNRHAKAP